MCSPGVACRASTSTSYWRRLCCKIGLGGKFLGDNLLRRLVNRPAEYNGMVRIVGNRSGLDTQRLSPRFSGANVCPPVKCGRPCIRDALTYTPKPLLRKILVTSNRKIWVWVRDERIWLNCLDRIRTTNPFTEENEASQSLVGGNR